jgi:hypothetical protein
VFSLCFSGISEGNKSAARADSVGESGRSNQQIQENEFFWTGAWVGPDSHAANLLCVIPEIGGTFLFRKASSRKDLEC